MWKMQEDYGWGILRPQHRCCYHRAHCYHSSAEGPGRCCRQLSEVIRWFIGYRVGLWLLRGQGSEFLSFFTVNLQNSLQGYFFYILLNIMSWDSASRSCYSSVLSCNTVWAGDFFAPPLTSVVLEVLVGQLEKSEGDDDSAPHRHKHGVGCRQSGVRHSDGDT